MKVRILFLALVQLVACQVFGQYNHESRRWALSGVLGPGILSNVHTVPMSGANALVETSTGTKMGLARGLFAEYYIPNSNFSIKAGYDRENINIDKVNISFDMSNILVGGRYYYEIQSFHPYGGIDLMYNVGERHFDVDGSVSGDHTIVGQTFKGHVQAAGFTFAPVVGCDIQLFSSVALAVEYGYRLSPNAHVNEVRTYDRGWGSTQTTGNLNRHHISIGLKFSFPFHWSGSDSSSLFEGLLNTMVNDDTDYNRYHRRR